MKELGEKRKQYMMDNSPTDIVLCEMHFREYSEFITSAGGDVTTYRVYGDKEFKMCIK